MILSSDFHSGGKRVMTKFLRTHSSGTNAVVNQGIHCWRITINLTERSQAPLTIAGFVVPTLESAKELADSEVLKFGHVCSRSCKEWVEVFGASSGGFSFSQ